MLFRIRIKKEELMRVALVFLLISLMFSGCSSTAKKIVLDSSSDRKPDWVKSSDLSWEKNDMYFFKGDYTIRGDERVNGCIDLAKMNVKEALITEIQESLRGALVSATESIQSSAEILLTKSQLSEYRGAISGLKFSSKYWEKYVLSNQEEKTSCYVLAKINKKDYLKTKKKIVDKVVSINPDLKKAIKNKQIDFFENEI